MTLVGTTSHNISAWKCPPRATVAKGRSATSSVTAKQWTMQMAESAIATRSK